MEHPMQPDDLPEEAITPETIDTEPEAQTFGAPRGAVYFVAAMLIFYIVYYGAHYYEIFILR